MGLPVPAKSAKVGRIESLHVLAKAGGTQSAGALEQTLLQLAEVVSNDNSKLILADELEAITEQELVLELSPECWRPLNLIQEHVCCSLPTWHHQSSKPLGKR